MNDRHVESLTYRITKRDAVEFDKAPALTVDRGAFQVAVDAYRATVTMRDHFASAEEARAVVEPFLRAWEFLDDLSHGDGIRFRFAGARVVDRSPTPAGGKAVRGSVFGITGSGSMRAVGRVSRRRWPDPPEGIALSPDVEIMHQRWLAYRQGREPLVSAAYWALTMLFVTAQAAGEKGGALPAAASCYNIDEKVLRKLSRFTSTKGGDEARKAKGLHAPLSPSERKWVEAAFKALVLRAAEWAYHGGPLPRQLTMADLPEL